MLETSSNGVKNQKGIVNWKKVHFPYDNQQGCDLRDIEVSPVLWTCEIQGTQNMLCIKKERFSTCQEQKLDTMGQWVLWQHSHD